MVQLIFLIINIKCIMIALDRNFNIKYLKKRLDSTLDHRIINYQIQIIQIDRINY